jgi:hypothetical protein
MTCVPPLLGTALFLVPENLLDLVKRTYLAQDKSSLLRSVLFGFVKIATCMCPASGQFEGLGTS